MNATENRRPLYRLKDLMRLINVGRSTVYDWLNARSPRYKKDFPRPIRLSNGSIRWSPDAVEAWIDAQQ